MSSIFYRLYLYPLPVPSFKWTSIRYDVVSLWRRGIGPTIDSNLLKKDPSRFLGWILLGKYTALLLMARHFKTKCESCVSSAIRVMASCWWYLRRNTTWFPNKHHLQTYTYAASTTTAHTTPSGSIQFPVVCLNGKNGKRKMLKRKIGIKYIILNKPKKNMKHLRPFMFYTRTCTIPHSLSLLCHKYEFQKKEET